MMTIDVNNGEFTFDKWRLSSKSQLSDIKEKFSLTEFELWVSNGQWLTYRLDISSEYILTIVFFDEVIKFIEIYPKNIADNEMSIALREVLEKLGGDRIYSWGKVELNIDTKAGYESVVISYH